MIYEAVDNNTGKTAYGSLSFYRHIRNIGYNFYDSRYYDFAQFTDLLENQRMYVKSIENTYSKTREEYSRRTFTLVFPFEREDVATVSVQIGDATITADVDGKEAVVMEHTVKGTPQQLDDLCAIDPAAFTGCAYDAQGNIVAELQDEA